MSTSGVCGKGTYNGAAAQAARYEFAPCILEPGHPKECDSGPAPLPRAA